MFALERQKRIMASLSRDGSVLVSKLSLELGVTEETIRRDLEKLEKQVPDCIVYRKKSHAP